MAGKKVQSSKFKVQSEESVGEGLPVGWETCELSQLGKWGSGGTPNRGNINFYENGTIPWLVIGDLNDGLVLNSREFITEAALLNSSAKLIPINSLLIAMYGSIGKLGLTGVECATNQAIAFCIPDITKITLKYLFYALMNEKPSLIMQGKGGAQQNISQTVLKEYPIPLAPLPEQKVIADKLDALLAQVDSLKARLDAIPVVLKRFRQSVLSAAVSGKLTEDWRGKKTKTIVSLDAIANIIDPHPSHRTPPSVHNGVPYIGIGDLLSDGSICFENAHKVSKDILKEHQVRYQVKNGDFIFGKIGTLGKPTRLPTGIDYTLSANVILIQPLTDKVNPNYLMYFLMSPDTMNAITDQSSATSQAAFGIKKMRAFECNLPALLEQSEIVRRVEQLFAFADQVEARVKAAQSRTQHLTQAILAKAFRGELTAEWREAHAKAQ